jgi:hypothetical protein
MPFSYCADRKLLSAMPRGPFTQPTTKPDARLDDEAPDRTKNEQQGTETPDFLTRQHGERAPGAEPRGKCWPYW